MVALACVLGGCSFRLGSMFGDAKPEIAAASDITGSIGTPVRARIGDDNNLTESDLALTRNAASEVMSRGSKDSSQPWENPQTGARGAVTPLASVYSSEGRTCRDFLASYVRGTKEGWLQGEACRVSDAGPWEIRSMKPWRRS